jgi:hypothetical protein
MNYNKKEDSNCGVQKVDQHLSNVFPRLFSYSTHTSEKSSTMENLEELERKPKILDVGIVRLFSGCGYGSGYISTLFRGKNPNTYITNNDDRIRSNCKECNGGSIYEHDRKRSICEECKVVSTPDHVRRITIFKKFKGGNICEHDKIRSNCNDCKKRDICERDRIRSLVIEYKGEHICDCERDRIRSLFIEYKGEHIWEHDVSDNRKEHHKNHNKEEKEEEKEKKKEKGKEEEEEEEEEEEIPNDISILFPHYSSFDDANGITNHLKTRKNYNFHNVSCLCGFVSHYGLIYFVRFFPDQDIVTWRFANENDIEAYSKMEKLSTSFPFSVYNFKKWLKISKERVREEFTVEPGEIYSKFVSGVIVNLLKSSYHQRNKNEFTPFINSYFSDYPSLDKICKIAIPTLTHATKNQLNIFVAALAAISPDLEWSNGDGEKNSTITFKGVRYYLDANDFQFNYIYEINYSTYNNNNLIVNDLKLGRCARSLFHNLLKLRDIDRKEDYSHLNMKNKHDKGYNNLKEEYERYKKILKYEKREKKCMRYKKNMGFEESLKNTGISMLSCVMAVFFVFVIFLEFLKKYPELMTFMNITR